MKKEFEENGWAMERRRNYHFLVFRPWHKEQFVVPDIPIPRGCKMVVVCTTRVSRYTTWQGIAFCSKNDKEDLDKGKWLAKQRALGHIEVKESDYPCA